MFLNRNLLSEMLLLLILWFLLILNFFTSALERSCYISVFLITISLNAQSPGFAPIIEVQWVVCLFLSQFMESDSSVAAKSTYRCFLANVLPRYASLKSGVDDVVTDNAHCRAGSRRDFSEMSCYWHEVFW